MKTKRAARSGDTEPGTEFDRALTLEQVAEILRREAGAGDVAIRRRLTLLMLTKSSAELQACWTVESQRPGLFEAEHMIDNWRQHLEDCLSLAKTARARLLLAGSVVAGLAP